MASSSSPSIREFSRIDDAAIFIDDTFDADTVRSIAGASPSAIVMLSPQRMPVDANGESPCAKGQSPTRANHNVDTQPTEYVSGVSDSARKRPPPGSRLFGTDLSNSTFGNNSASKGAAPPHSLRHYGSRLSFSACTTPKDPRKSTGVTRPVILGRRASSAGETHVDVAASPLPNVTTVNTATSPNESLADILRRYVPVEEFERLEKERNRYREMYRYQAQLCEELTKREAEAQSALQEKIIEIIALSSRNEESKRFIRQMKREMQDCRERTLPFLNRKLDEIRVEQQLKEKYEGIMRAQEAAFEAEKAEMEKEMGALEALLKDSKCAAGMGKNSDSLLRASYLKNTRMFNDLYHTRRERDAEMERRLELEKQIEQLRKERRDVEFTLAKERRMHSTREEQLIEDVHVMHEEVMALTSELLEVQLQRDEEAQLAADREDELRARVEESEGFRIEGSLDEHCQEDAEDGVHADKETARIHQTEICDDEDEEEFHLQVVADTSTPPIKPSEAPRPLRRPFAVPQQ